MNLPEVYRVCFRPFGYTQSPFAETSGPTVPRATTLWEIRLVTPSHDTVKLRQEDKGVTGGKRAGKDLRTARFGLSFETLPIDWSRGVLEVLRKFHAWVFDRRRPWDGSIS